METTEIIDQLQRYHKKRKRIFISSSFQTHSIPLLHIVSKSNVPIDVLFINTGFHFPETVGFKNQIAELLNLNVIDVRPNVPKIQQKDSEGNFYFVSNPDYCCFMNKEQPLETYLSVYDIWISGVRGDQSKFRKNLNVESDAPMNTLRFHPLLDWNAKKIFEYRMQYNLPEHPLDAQGYQSIGCMPCTRKLDLNDERSARWFGMNKTECGLHTNMVSK